MRIARTRRRQGLKSQALQTECAADIPWVGNDKAAGLMKLVENLAFFGGRRSRHGAFQSAKSLRLGKQSATTAAAMTSRDHDLDATWVRLGFDLGAAVGRALMVVPRNRFLRDTLIFHGRL